MCEGCFLRMASTFKNVKDWLQGQNLKFPQKQIFDPNTKQVRDPQQCQILHIIARLIFEDSTRKISSTGAKANPSFVATFEKSFLPHINLDSGKHIHQYYLAIEGMELCDSEGTHLSKLSSKAGVLIVQPNEEEKK